ncbi:DUF4920 domain-containing protein [Limibacter armeniacum]|uniref:DUF4920 domain-containing protein n=1 Tax=Limibacter armeniacum TaxID=466084 RepID=UPI002FE5A315
MKKKLLIIIATALFLGCSSPQQPHGDLKHYGEKITTLNSISGTALIRQLEQADSLAAVKVTGEVTSSCEVKGCWMKLKLDNSHEMMVKFKDYGFFVPKGLESGTATVEGVVKKEVVSVDVLRHYAEDAGKSEDEINAITEPQEKIVFVAKGVIIEGGVTAPSEEETKTSSEEEDSHKS